MPIHLELVTPERMLFQDEVDQVTLPTSEGEITVLSNHLPLVAQLVAGTMRLKKDGVEEDVAVSSGFIQIQVGNHVRVLAETAERAVELDLSVIEAAKQRAEQVMKESTRKDDVSYASAAAGIERELARYRIAKKHAGSHHVPTLNSTFVPRGKNVQ